MAFISSFHPLLIHRRNCCKTSSRRLLTCSFQEIDRSEKLISVKDVSLWWPNGRAGLQDVSLDIHAGELAMILGPNGCGKSTLLRVVRGLLIPPMGSTSFESPCAYVLQNPSEQIIMPSIGTDIELSIPDQDELSEEEIQEKVMHVLRIVGLEPPEKFATMSSHRLSGGQQQRAVVAAALAMEPRTILFDEATASMDPFNKAELITRVRRIVSEKRIGAMWVTHLLDELEFADTIIIMDHGKIIASGPRVALMPLVYDMVDAAERDFL